MTLALLLTTLALAGPPCDERTSAVDVVGALVAADTAFVEMDLGTFERAHQRALEALDCLAEPLDPVEAAWLHRVTALSSFVKQDDEGARRAFQSSLALQPRYVLSPRIAPEGNPLRLLYDEATALPESAVRPLEPPEDLTLYVDGTPAEERPVERPIVLQGVERSGEVQASTYLEPAAQLPPWALTPLPELPPLAERPERTRRALFIASGATAAAAGGLYTWAWVSHGKYMDPDTPLEDLDGLRARTNTATVGSAIAGGVGLGLASAALVIPW